MTHSPKKTCLLRQKAIEHEDCDYTILNLIPPPPRTAYIKLEGSPTPFHIVKKEQSFVISATEILRLVVTKNKKIILFFDQQLF